MALKFWRKKILPSQHFAKFRFEPPLDHFSKKFQMLSFFLGHIRGYCEIEGKYKNKKNEK